jgi:sialate O-acetylesterase
MNSSLQMKLQYFLVFAIVFFIEITPGFGILKTRRYVPSLDSSFKVANVFQSSMVLQQNKPFAIWGYAPPGAKITVKGDWSDKIVTIVTDSQDYWKGEIPVPKAIKYDFRPHTLTITTKDSTVKFSNLLIGEVWLASGQSNMQFQVDGKPGTYGGVVNYQNEIANAAFPNIRLLHVDVTFKAQPYNEITGKWVACTPETAAPFSAVAYYFARYLYQHLNIPVGIILSTIGASSGQAWTSRKVLASDSLLYKWYLKGYDNDPKSREPVTTEMSFGHVLSPTLLYNAILHPLTGFSIKGFIWYQGESNRADNEKYTRLLTYMIQGWRDDFGQGDLPFYFVLMPPYKVTKTETLQAYDYATFRASQMDVRKLKNTEIANIMDLNEPENLHPHNKKPAGERLAMIALNKDYGLKAIPYLGPQVKKIKITGSHVKISFKNTVVGGLATSDSLAPRQFFVAGDDKVFHIAKAAIDGNNVVLECDSVSNPVAVRYAFINQAVTNLMNKAGLPAEPFRTDDWNEKIDVKK